jgi:CO/xanthine dehydrogenase Mo-binding subunit
MMNQIGASPLRKEGRDKVTGRVKYAADGQSPDLLHGAMKTSPHAFAKIIAIDCETARKMPGVKAILTGDDFESNLGIYLCDKPPIARKIVRYFGEVVAVVVASNYRQACAARDAILVSYDVFKPILSPKEALSPNAEIIHKEMADYSHISPIHPEPGTNIANRTKIRKGDVDKGFLEAAYIIETEVEIPPGDHVAMEPRVAIAEIKPTGEVHITSSTQAPFVVKGLMSICFDIEPGKIVVKAPLIGGGFGGKAGIQLEGLAYLLSQKVGGRPVKLVNTREEDMVTSPGHIGLQARVKLGADATGRLTAMSLEYLFNSGGYADYAVNVSRAAAISCTGPYRVENVSCDSLCVYTNLPFATAYRGFGHIEMSFAIERGMDQLADALNMDPITFRIINGIKAGDTTPVQSMLNQSTGAIAQCFKEVEDMLGGRVGYVEPLSENRVLVKGVSGLWKAPAMPTNTDAGAILTFNSDGSCNVHTGVVEIGQGTKTGIAQIASELLKLPFDKVHVQMEVDTRVAPSDWATAASRGLFMVGNAVFEACIDAIEQFKATASEVLRVPVRDLVLGDERIYVNDEPEKGLKLSQLALGYVYPNGNAIRGQIIGKGRYIAKELCDIDRDTGKGHPDLEWTLGAEGVAIEVNLMTGQYKVIKAVCCIDVGRVINPELARGQTVGGMAMGLGYTTMEGFKFNEQGHVSNGILRDYKIMRLGDAPVYEVRFLETPQQDGPFGARGLGEQSVIGMPGAISNALSRAIHKQVNQIPITPESLWRLMKEESDDRL